MEIGKFWWKSARARREKKENCIGLSHHNININENDLINAKTWCGDP
jgi:hypothetical protein